MKYVILFKIKDLCNKSLKLSEEALTFVRQTATCSLSLIHSIWISFFAIISFTRATSILKCQSFTRFDNFKVSSRGVLSVLQRTLGCLCGLNVSYSMTAINTPESAASLNARVSKVNGVLLTQSSCFDDQLIGTILFVVPQKINK